MGLKERIHFKVSLVFGRQRKGRQSSLLDLVTSGHGNANTILLSSGDQGECNNTRTIVFHLSK